MDIRELYAQKIEPAARDFYRKALDLLMEHRVPFLVGGAYALQRYAAVERTTKDFDIFTREEDCKRALDLFASLGYKTEMPFPHWLGKIHHEELVVDVIFGSGNGITTVDEDWFKFAVDDVVLDTPIKLVPPEEMIYSKAFIMERERYDGADVNHIILATGEKMDWRRLLIRFGPHWKILLNHLVLFDFVYPSERAKVPAWVFNEMFNRYTRELGGPPQPERICYGTLISREQYLKDIEEWGFEDPRTIPKDHLQIWTEAIKPPQ